MKNKGTFSLNKGKTIYSWYQYTEGYSEEFVLNEIEKIGSVSSVYDPFGGSGTTMLYSSFKGIKSYFSEINPFMAWVCNTKINSSKYAYEHIDQFEEVVNKIIHECSNNISNITVDSPTSASSSAILIVALSFVVLT